jgi:succinoglycan biosynthesis transport protein ExoP
LPATDQHIGDAPRYVTLRDYLQVVREQRLLVVATMLAFVAAAVAFSLRQDPTYRAEAALSFADVSGDANLLGSNLFPAQTPEQLAATSAQRVTSRAVAVRVRRKLRSDAAVSTLQDNVQARPEARTNLVVVEAEWSSGSYAARLANAFAREARDAGNRDARRRFARAAASLQRELGRLQRTTADPTARALFADRIARLESLRRFAAPVQLTRPATAPGSPVAPRPVRNGILAGILGLTLGILAAFVRDSLDRRLRSAREIQEQVKLPLLAAVRNEAMGHAGPVANGRGPMPEADLEAFRILRTNLDFLNVDNPVRTVAVTSALPEEGKSTVAASLAFANAAAGRSTLLVECDLRRPGLARRLGIAPTPGLVEYLVGQASPQEVLQTVPTQPPGGDAAVPAPPGGQRLVCIVAGNPRPRPAELLGSRRFKDFLKQVSQAYDAVVLDTSPLLSVGDTLELVPQVDGVVVCVRAARTTRDQARAAKAAIDHLPARPAGLVVTGVRPGDEVDYGYYYSHATRA